MLNVAIRNEGGLGRPLIYIVTLLKVKLMRREVQLQESVQYGMIHYDTYKYDTGFIIRYSISYCRVPEMDGETEKRE